MTGRISAAIGACFVVLMVLGTLLWGFAIPAMFPDALGPGGASTQPPNFAFILLSQVFFAIFLVLLVGRWAAAGNFAAAFAIGGVAGFLIMAATTFSILAVMPDGSLAKAIVEPMLAIPVHGTAAGVAAVVLARGRTRTAGQ
jgi:hypothetical protein